MASRHVVAAVCVSAVLVGVSAATASEADVPRRTGVVFTVFEELPPGGACPGVYAVDARTREISWLGGWDAARQDTAVYPAFTPSGTFTFGHFSTPNTTGLPLVDVYAAGRIAVERALSFATWRWSPRRNEVAYVRIRSGGGELVVTSATGATRVLVRYPAVGLWWLPDGSGLVYGPRAGSTEGITFVRRDGRVRKVLARSASHPVVSPDGRRVAFLRARSRLDPGGLWVVGSRGGPARRVLGPAPYERLRPAVWLSNRELLVQHGGTGDTIFDVSDTLTRVDVDTRRERPFLKHAFALSLSPDRNRVLFVRPHRGGETYYSIRTVRTDGRGEQLLAVTDEEDLNIGSMPVWKPAAVQLDRVGELPPVPITPEACVARLTAVRARTP